MDTVRQTDEGPASLTGADLAGLVMFHLPAPGQLQLLVEEQVEEGDQVTVVLVALEVVRVSPHLADHVLQAGVARKHTVGTLERKTQQRETIKQLMTAS